ncbi:MAG: protein-glutamate O-methyltransferase [Alphaproteobacteria bacterium]|nr:protein-glutamate O-methyltransferase [Alphaproteobacteria bacterium]MBV8548303.1 protein-glutamate O-methyltransferase [Alphaproteobacteria bacterium]
MKSEDFELFSGIVRQRSGLVLTPEKAYLIESRLTPVVRKYNLKTLEDMADLIRSKKDESILKDITEAMTTNESFFFRDNKPFTNFQNIVLPKLLTARADKKHIRIWSAASSSGQEAYSLAMICSEMAARLTGWRIDIVGTDISREMVERSRQGIYSQFEVQRGLPVTHLVKYFQQLSSDRWQISEKLRAMATFREANLLTDVNSLGAFDVVFCRNVLIYFDVPTKKRVLDSIYNLMPNDGVLFLGGAETVLGISDKFSPMPGEHGMYVKSTEAKPQSAFAATGTKI